MANFDPPIASVGGVIRPPTTLEKNNGLQCGPADLKLFNFLFQKLQAELKAIQDAGGIVGTDGDDTTVLQAIMALISAATGGGDTSEYVLFSQAKTRLPFFPHVEANDGLLTVTTPATGTVRVANGSTILFRGINPVVLGQTDFATDPSKIYHLRCNQTTGLALRDCTTGTSYNPGGLDEKDPSFDSTYDDALLARVITSVANVPTITPLSNQARVFKEMTSIGNMTTASNADDAQRTANLDFNMARTPVMALTAENIVVGGSGGTFMTGSQIHDHDTDMTRLSFSRYGTSLRLRRDYATRFDIRAVLMA